MKTSYKLLLIAILCIMPFGSYGQMDDSKILGLEEAERIVTAAYSRAVKDDWNVVIAVVDAGGHLIFLKRMDGTQLASIEIAIQKAKTSVLYKRPTKAFQDGVVDGNLALLRIPDMLPFEGGLPIEHNGKIRGAIGVSGVTPQQDGVIAQAGLDGF